MQLLIDNPLLLLVVIAAIGYPLGQIKIRGISLGVAGVLFVGLGFGALHPDLKLPEIISTLGLVVFVYTVGLSSGPAFFRSLRRRGLRYNLFAAWMTVVATAATLGVALAFSLRPALAAGLFAGSLTNTPALAAVIENLKASAPPDQLERLLAEPVIGYSIAYPMGVLGMILAVALAQRLWRVDYTAERAQAGDFATPGELQVRTIQVSHPEATLVPIRDLVSVRNGCWKVVFARLKRGDDLMLVDGDVTLRVGDLVSAVGRGPDLEGLTTCLGEVVDRRLDFDRSELDYRRMFVSDERLVGRRLRDLRLIQSHGAVVTRLRRGDFDLLPDGDTVLELGDQVQVVAHRTRLDDVRQVFGDSYRALGEVDVMTLSIGLALGLLLGSIPVPLPGGLVLRLGNAGGPLIVALVLGTIGSTGRWAWTLPYSSNLTLRQIGLVLFLAGVGTRSGYAFVTTLIQGDGLSIFVAGLVVTTAVALGTLWIGRVYLNVPMAMLAGMLAGIQTQPALLGFALEQSGDDLPNVGYATVYPLAMIAKILLAQLVLALLLARGA